MKEAKISQVKNHLSRYLQLVRQGEVVRILDRNVPVAQIVPIRSPGPERTVGAEALLEMERKGLIRPKLPEAVILTPLGQQYDTGLRDTMFHRAEH